MRNKNIWLINILYLLSITTISFASLQQEGRGEVIELIDPLPGSAVQGLVQIIGTISIDGLEFYRLEFSSQKTQSKTWFLINENDLMITNDIIGEWDTSVLTDGIYDLRLTVVKESGESTVELSEGIRIRNYTPIETDTPSPTSDVSFPTTTIEFAPTTTPTTTILPSPTSPRPNPAGVDQTSIADAVLIGGIIGSVGTLILALYINIRRNQ
jgi:hypothetical protein